jgi:hypothetical protein
MDTDLNHLITILIEGQIRTDKSVGDLASLLTSHVDLTESRVARIEEAHVRIEEAHARTEDAIANLAINADKYVATADARMKRIEENLDGLIRAIAREHTNGKGH